MNPSFMPVSGEGIDDAIDGLTDAKLSSCRFSEKYEEVSSSH